MPPPLDSAHPDSECIGFPHFMPLGLLLPFFLPFLDVCLSACLALPWACNMFASSLSNGTFLPEQAVPPVLGRGYSRSQQLICSLHLLEPLLCHPLLRLAADAPLVWVPLGSQLEVGLTHLR